MGDAKLHSLDLGKDPDGNPDTPKPLVDPTPFFTANTCNISIWFGSSPPFGVYSESNKLDLRDTLEPLVYASCALGTGAWVETDEFASNGYYWINQDEPEQAWWFSGRVAWGYLEGLEETATGVDVTMQIDMVDGSFPYISSDTVAPRGTGGGIISATNCEDLGDTDFF